MRTYAEKIRQRTGRYAIAAPALTAELHIGPVFLYRTLKPSRDAALLHSLPRSLGSLTPAQD